MQPNVIIAEAIGHRTRFAWLGAVLAATVALLVASALLRHDARASALAQERALRAERAMWTQHRCHKARYSAERAAERAERRARAAAERAERRARAAVERRARLHYD